MLNSFLNVASVPRLVLRLMIQLIITLAFHYITQQTYKYHLTYLLGWLVCDFLKLWCQKILQLKK